MVGMPGHTTEPKHNGAVLERSVAIPKTRADRAHFRARRVAHHLSQPASFATSISLFRNARISPRAWSAARLFRRLKLNGPGSRKILAAPSASSWRR